MVGMAALLRRGEQAQAAVRSHAMAMQDDLHARVFLVEENGAEGAVVEHDADASRIEIAVGSDLHLNGRVHRGSRKGQEQRNERENDENCTESKAHWGPPF